MTERRKTSRRDIGRWVYTIGTDFIHNFDDWYFFVREIFLRFYLPFGSVRFVFYFLVIVLGIGGIGAWILYFNNEVIYQFYYSLATFSLTLAAATFADVTLIKNNGNSEDYFSGDLPEIVVFPYNCIFIIIFICAVVGLLLCGFDLATTNAKFDKDTGVFFSKVSFFLSLFFWWQVNSKNPKLLKTELDPQNPYGDSDQIDSNKTDDFNVK
jgi:hypothetical protein